MSNSEIERLKGELIGLITGNVSPEKKGELVDRLGLTREQAQPGQPQAQGELD